MNRTIKSILSILTKTKTMKTLQLEDSKAKELYKTASSEFKAMLEDSFGKAFFQDKITDRIKNFADICREVGTSEEAFNLKYLNYDSDTKGYEKCKLIIKVLNEGWFPNWNDGNEKKWYAWFNYNSGASAFVFDFTDCDYTNSGSHGGSRLRLKTQELAIFFGKIFTKEINEYLLG